MKVITRTKDGLSSSMMLRTGIDVGSCGVCGMTGRAPEPLTSLLGNVSASGGISENRFLFGCLDVGWECRFFAIREEDGYVGRANK